ncbi:MAG: hypothetical protein CMF23_02700 [Ignavibacteriae bacterium]|nr:hypothetical protein [Ignavibacteriota bacterium]
MKRITPFLLIIIFVSTLQAQIDYKKLDQYIENGVSLFEAEGLSIAIVKDSQVVFSKAYGFADADKKIPLTTKSLFNIASCSKAFTAALAAKLVDEGKLSFQDKVKDHIPYFELSDLWITSQLNIVDILSHRSGLKTFAGDLLWYHTDYTNKEIIERMKYLPIENEFRSEFGYQNNMFMIASEIITQKAGKNWYEYLDNELFDKLDMNTSKSASMYLNDNDDIAYPHVEKKRYPLTDEVPNAAGSIFSNVEEMSNWIKMLLNNGKFNGEQVLSENVINEMFTPRINVYVGRSMKKMGVNFNNYGLGWFLYDYKGREIVFHDGGMPGYLSRVLLVPDENLGVVILTNGLNPLTSALSQQIVDLYFGNDDADWVKDYKERIDNYKKRDEENKAKINSSRVENTKPSLELPKYEGKYNDNSYGEAEVIFNNEKLTLQLPAKDVFTSEMEHWHFDTFKIKFKDDFLPEGFVTFSFNSKGEVTGFKIDLPNPDFHFNDLNFVKVN